MDHDIQGRRIEKLEERVNKAETDIAALSSKLHLMNDDLSRRINEVNVNLKEDVERIRIDLRERITDLKNDIRQDIHNVSTAVNELEDGIEQLTDTLQGLRITQIGSSHKVNFNEKTVWGIVGVLVTIALYIAQDLIKTVIK